MIEPVVKVEFGGTIGTTKDVSVQYAGIYTRLFADIHLGILGGRLVG